MQLKLVYENLLLVNICAHKDLAFINAIEDEFLTSKVLLCI